MDIENTKASKLNLLIIKLNNFINSNYGFLLALGISILLTFLFYGRIIFSDNFLTIGHDFEYHLGLLAGLSKLFDSGDVFEKIIPFIYSNMGYGTQIFYGTFNHIITILISKAFGLTIMNAIKVHISLVMIMNGLLMYFFLLKFYKNRWYALFGSFVYLCSPYIMSDFVYRFAYSEFFMSTYIILCVWGTFDLISGDLKHFYPIFIIGFTLAFLTHLGISVWVIVLCFSILCVNYKKVLENKKWLHLIIASIIIILIASYYLLPMAQSVLSGKYNISDGNLTDTNNLSCYKSTSVIFYDFTWIGNFYNKIPYEFIMLYILISYSIISSFIRNKKNKHLLFYLVITIIFLLMASKLGFIWLILLKPFLMVQFPWRLLMIVEFCFAGLSPFILKFFAENRFKILAITICCISCLMPCFVIGLDVSIGKSLSNDYLLNYQDTTFSLGSLGEYLVYGKEISNVRYFYSNNLLDGESDPYIVSLQFLNDNKLSICLKDSYRYTTISHIILTKLPYDENVNIKDIELKKISDNDKYSVIEENERDIIPYNNNGNLAIKFDCDCKFYDINTLIIDYSSSQNIIDYVNDNALLVNKLSGEIKISEVKFDTNDLVFNANNVSNAEIELPIIYYEGYDITLTNENNEIKKLNYSASDNGFIKINLGENGKVQVKYVGTKLVKFSKVISIVSLCLSLTYGIGYLIFDSIKNRDKKKIINIIK
jgi:hypothetical protein